MSITAANTSNESQSNSTSLEISETSHGAQNETAPNSPPPYHTITISQSFENSNHNSLSNLSSSSIFSRPSSPTISLKIDSPPSYNEVIGSFGQYSGDFPASVIRDDETANAS